MVLNAESGSSVNVTFTGQTQDTVLKSVTGSGSNQEITLTATEIQTLGQGPISAVAVATDAVGNEKTTAAVQLNLATNTTAIADEVQRDMLVDGGASGASC